ncbi:MAG: 23S rRNA (uracil(1939)-C(5))-methyltransferase RlmD [Planctomycetota bacterium]
MGDFDDEDDDRYDDGDRERGQRPPAPVRRGDHVTLDVEAFADGPDMLARIDSYVVLLPGALPGERVRAAIQSGARKFGRARVLHVDRASPDRVEPRCRHFLDCGGCHWQHVGYAAQLRQKQARVEKDLRFALGDDAPPVEACVPAPEPYGQRHKVALHLVPGGRSALLPALHRARDVDLVALRECPAVAPKAFALGCRAIELLGELRLPPFDPFTGHGLLRSVLVRHAAATGQSHLLVVASGEVPELRHLLQPFLDAGATTVSLNLNDGPPGRLLGHTTHLLTGPRRIDEILDGTTYCISPDAFFQTSPHGARELVRAVTAWLDPGPRDVVADLYCGGGLFALPLAARAGTVIGVEDSGVSIADAEAGQKRNRRRNARFVRGAADRVLLRFGNELPRPDLAVLDPPRAGAGPAVLERLCALRPRRIAYVACEPSALARDLLTLRGLGYAARSVLPVDMFPQTWHVEAVARLEPIAGADPAP